jgi:flagellar hook assembly protein FlgD
LDDTEATIDSTLVEDYVGYGVYAVGNYTLNITHCEFLGDGTGVHVEDNQTNDGVIATSTFEDNEIAISYYASIDPDIDDCLITGNDTGVRCDAIGSPSIEHCMDTASYNGDITSNTVGIFCTDYSSPLVSQCNISSNQTGVAAWEESDPDLENGSNKFKSNTSKHIRNFTEGLTINARVNYWYTNSGSPNYYPQATKIGGDVDYTNALSEEPSFVLQWPGPTDTPPKLVTALGKAHPNPFNPTVEIPYTLSETRDVAIEIFDVAGRLVRTLVNTRQERGEYAVSWDGSGERGSPAASSVYFVRMRAGSFVTTQKIVLLK